ncbi:hypothetical protein CRE_24861 [Caenorhabditis remanei]|uniref:Uncharacterized protein n=1 Tax=Caenorhabditis remanei TaxID=31234 RepID=E3NLQ1_CAERE|nr:hypothetical protein CRE_24861 [Caenorhabditis remanei]
MSSTLDISPKQMEKRLCELAYHAQLFREWALKTQRDKGRDLSKMTKIVHVLKSIEFGRLVFQKEERLNSTVVSQRFENLSDEYAILHIRAGAILKDCGTLFKRPSEIPCEDGFTSFLQHYTSRWRTFVDDEQFVVIDDKGETIPLDEVFIVNATKFKRLRDAAKRREEERPSAVDNVQELIDCLNLLHLS